ncbi:MAG: STAS domain-containing protein [Planctomycetes bacterium]|nr:STAS domain-containing protein [Planctomycetota bacterium]
MPVEFKIVPNSVRQPNARDYADCVLDARMTYLNAPGFGRELSHLLRARRRFVTVDCAAVRHMDGAAVATLLEFAMACGEAQVQLRFKQPTRAFRDAFSLYNLGHLVGELTQAPDDEHTALVIIVEDDFDDSIRLPAVKAA